MFSPSTLFRGLFCSTEAFIEGKGVNVNTWFFKSALKQRLSNATTHYPVKLHNHRVKRTNIMQTGRWRRIEVTCPRQEYLLRFATSTPGFCPSTFFHLGFIIPSWDPSVMLQALIPRYKLPDLYPNSYPGRHLFKQFGVYSAHISSIPKTEAGYPMISFCPSRSEPLQKQRAANCF